MQKKTRTLGLWLGLAIGGFALSHSREAEACGGFFCSANQPVNQAAERIVFADNGDGTVTAVIQILYQGTAPKFSWLLPISTVPTGATIAVASNVGFQRLQQATNPQYTLTKRVEGTCKTPPASFGYGGSSASAGGAPTAIGVSNGNSGVTVEASGTVGAFDWTTISVDRSLADPADSAVKWLEDNGYTVGAGTQGLIRPYLADGLFLLALRLTKGAESGSIRPIVLTYEAARPMIPIKLTAVAANDDMGVMTWLLSSSRGVPQNYNSLELNEARINWFNAASNYNSVVTAAADEAGGQGFVTEFAGANSTLGSPIWTSSDANQLQQFQSRTYATFQEVFDASYAVWGGWDGFWDAITPLVNLPVPLATYQSCPGCYRDQVTFAGGNSVASYLDALDTQVFKPMQDFQKLFDAHTYVSRLYTTMSASEMTVDPLFTFNRDLPALSNLHTAERIIECSPDLYETDAPWRIALPQGTVRGTGQQAQSRLWPSAFDSQPATSRILQLSASGSGVVREDNTKAIATQLASYNWSLGSGGAATGSGGQTNPTAGNGSGGLDVHDNGEIHHSSSCAVSFAPRKGSWVVPLLIGLAAAMRRRRRAIG